MQPRKYKVFFHHGAELGLKTRACKGVAWVDDKGLHVQGADGATVIAKDRIQRAEFIRLHGSLRVIQIDHADGRLFLGVVRFMIGQFALGNFFANGRLLKEISAM
jgi:hypothetical protein